MNIVKFLTKAFFAGILFSTGVYFTIAVLLPALGLIDDSDYFAELYEETVKETEGRIGKPCTDVYREAIEFAENDIAKIIEHGTSGGDWVAVITPIQKEFIEFNDDWLMDCELARSSAAELGEIWPEFTGLHRLYSSLSTFSTSYSSLPATSIGLNPQAFEDVNYYYRNVTNSSKRTR